MRGKRSFPVLGASLLISAVFLVVSSFQIVGGLITRPKFPEDNQLSPLTQSPNFDASDLLAVFNGQTIKVPSEIARDQSDRKVLGINMFANKYILVDLSTQMLHAFEDGKEIMSTFISSGKWGPTPTGTFHIWGKYRFIKMSGGSHAAHDYYYLPNVPYVMFFANAQVPGGRGFSLHGTYWHDNFGHPMSHGCVNMRTADAGELYSWTGPIVPEGQNSVTASTTNPGTEIIIVGQPP